MHNYAGNPNSYPPTVALMDDGVDAPTWSNFAPGFQGALDRAAWLKAHAGATGLLSTWSSWSWGTGSIGPGAMCFFDYPLYQGWIVTAYGTSGLAAGKLQSYLVIDGAASTVPVVPSGGVSTPNLATSVAVDQNSNVWMSSYDGTHLQTWIAAVGGGSWTAFPAATVANVTDFKVVLASGNGIAAVGTSVSGTAALGSTSFATGFVAASSPAGVTASSWILKSNGTTAMAIPYLSTASTVYTTSDGVTWTSAFVALASGEKPIDVCWDPVLSRWVMLTQIAPGGVGRLNVWAFAGGVWTQIGTNIGGALGTVPTTGQAIACVGGNFFALVTASGSFAAANAFSLIASYDGVTWWAARTIILGNGTGQFPENGGGNGAPILVSAPNQLAATVPPTSVGTGVAVRFSGLFGQADVNL